MKNFYGDYDNHEKVDALHAILHPSRADEGLYRKNNNPSGCDKSWCLNYIPEFASALENCNMKVVPNG